MSASSTDSPSLVLLSANGRKVPVCGKSLEAALWAAALVDTVLRRGTDIPLPSSRDGGTQMVRVTAKVVGNFLCNVYADDAAAVSEAVMALRKYDAARASWLLRVLTTTPELVSLAKAVHFELTGDPSNVEGRAG